MRPYPDLLIRTGSVGIIITITNLNFFFEEPVKKHGRINENNNENQILKVISSISVLYEDNHLLVVEKPVNMPVQEDASGDPDLLSVLKQDIKMRYQKPGNVYLGLVHRLDRPTGGVKFFAKTSNAPSRISEQVRSRSFGKV